MQVVSEKTGSQRKALEVYMFISRDVACLSEVGTEKVSWLFRSSLVIHRYTKDMRVWEVARPFSDINSFLRQLWTEEGNLNWCWGNPEAPSVSL